MPETRIYIERDIARAKYAVSIVVQQEQSLVAIKNIHLTTEPIDEYGIMPVAAYLDKSEIQSIVEALQEAGFIPTADKATLKHLEDMRTLLGLSDRSDRLIEVKTTNLDRNHP